MRALSLPDSCMLDLKCRRWALLDDAANSMQNGLTQLAGGINAARVPPSTGMTEPVTYDA
jgi:hypothetical protein